MTHRRPHPEETGAKNVLDCNLGGDVLSRADGYVLNFRCMSVRLRPPSSGPPTRGTSGNGGGAGGNS